MSKNKAWIQYTKQGEIVPGSLIVSPRRPVNGVWYEVVTDICCDIEPLFGLISSRQKAFVKYDASGNIVPGSLVLTDGRLPRPGIWKEVYIDICCSTTSTTTTTTSTTTTTTTGTPSLKFLFSQPIPELNTLSFWNNFIFVSGNYVFLIITTVGSNTLYELFGSPLNQLQNSPLWTLNPTYPPYLLEISDEINSINILPNSAFEYCTNLSYINLPAATVIDDNSFSSIVNNNRSYINLSSCLNLGTTTGNNFVFNSTVGNTITLVVPAALMNAQGPGVPDGDIQYLQANNTVTVITV